MPKFYLTFGQVHAHRVPGIEETFDKDCVAEIEAFDDDEARDIAFSTFGPKWAFLYTEKPDMQFFPRGIIKLK